MNLNLIFSSGLLAIFVSSTSVVGQSAANQSGNGQSAAPSAQGSAVSYTSVTQLNGLLGQLEAASKTAQVDLAKLRIEKWKTDGPNKKVLLSKLDSIQRDLQGTLPDEITQLRNSPEDMPATFKLYRNLDALYDVMGNVVESAGAFGSKDEFQSVANDQNIFESTRKQLAERIESLTAAKEAEIVRLRNDLSAARAAIPAAPPKKNVVDDNEPPKKPLRKKKPATAPDAAAPAKPSAGQAQAPATEPVKPQ